MIAGLWSSVFKGGMSQAEISRDVMRPDMSLQEMQGAEHGLNLGMTDLFEVINPDSVISQKSINQEVMTLNATTQDVNQDVSLAPHQIANLTRDAAPAANRVQRAIHALIRALAMQTVQTQDHRVANLLLVANRLLVASHPLEENPLEADQVATNQALVVNHLAQDRREQDRREQDLLAENHHGAGVNIIKQGLTS